MTELVSSPDPADVPDDKLEQWVLAVQGAALCDRFERANRRWLLPIAVTWHENTRLIEVRDLQAGASDAVVPSRIMIARPERIFRYRRGVAHRVAKLARKYFIDRVPLSAGDVVIDCGANVGEIGLFVRSQADARVVAIEPSKLEADACDENLYSGKIETHRVALWDSAGELTFYDSNATGDSSLISPASPSISASTIPTRTLADLVASEGIGRIQILKIEGEGAEPEILAGSKDIISRVAHCTVDCGPERGPSQDHVIPQVCNFLFDAGFELRDVNLERHIFWFQNRKEV